MATIFMPPEIDGTQPVAVILHGVGGNRGEYTALAEAVSGMGAIVLNADWKADIRNPARSVGEAVCAVAYAHLNAAAWGGDPDRVIVIGHSGGGHVGMLAALAGKEHIENCDTAEDSVVWAWIGLAGDPGTASPGGNAFEIWKADPNVDLVSLDAFSHLGGTEHNHDLIARAVHGTADSTVRLERAEAFHEALADADYDTELITVEGAGHMAPAQPGTEAGDVSLRVIEDLIELAGAGPALQK